MLGARPQPHRTPRIVLLADVHSLVLKRTARYHMMMVPGSSTVSLISLCGSTMVPLRNTSSCAPHRHIKVLRFV